MHKPLLFCTALSISMLAAETANAEDSEIQIDASKPDPPGYVCLKKTVGNGKASKEVKVCTLTNKPRAAGGVSKP